jgi:hypothetical protein
MMASTFLLVTIHGVMDGMVVHLLSQMQMVVLLPLVQLMVIMQNFHSVQAQIVLSLF